MPPDPRAYLWDARRALTRVGEFIADRTWEDYSSNALIRSAVERQFEIVGEALNRVRQADPDLAGRIADLPRIVAFRNLLIHAYAAIDDRIVWEVATQRAPALIAVFDELLRDES